MIAGPLHMEPRASSPTEKIREGEARRGSERVSGGNAV